MGGALNPHQGSAPGPPGGRGHTPAGGERPLHHWLGGEEQAGCWKVWSSFRRSMRRGIGNWGTGKIGRLRTSSRSGSRSLRDRVAVIDGDQAVTYRQLDERSTRLALNLLDAGPTAARPDRGAATERGRVRLPLFRAAEDRRDPDHGAAVAPLPRGQPVRASCPARWPARCPDRQGDFDFAPLVGPHSRREPDAASSGLSWARRRTGFLSLAGADRAGADALGGRASGDPGADRPDRSVRSSSSRAARPASRS